MDRSQLEALRHVGGLIAGALRTSTLAAFVRLGVADALAAGGRTGDDLAEATGTSPPDLLRLLRAAQTLGLVDAVGDGTFELTVAGACLVTEAEPSLASLAVVTHELLAPLWRRIDHCVSTGTDATEVVLGASFYDHLAGQPQLDDVWNRAMEQTAWAWLAAVPDATAWVADHAEVVDVGGGTGAFARHLLRVRPDLHVTVVDLPHVVAARPTGTDDRIAFVGADFRTAVPVSSPCYLFARVLMNWPDADARRVLRHCRERNPAAEVVVVDYVVPDGVTTHAATVADLDLMTMGGRARTAMEWDALLGEVGLRRTAVTYLLPGAWAVLRALPA
ncbi:MAG TPA: methyltransferase [Acidimicrobiales bacterium]|nr:methyltransferase [Acidimicrobiales bacterium]